MGTNRAVFACPSTKPIYRWEIQAGNPNRLGADTDYTPNPDPWGIKASPTGSFFSYGYNDWGGGPVTQDIREQLGLGGDINPPGQPEMPESRVLKPSEVIMLGDSKTDGSWDANIDPRDIDQWPSSRHAGRAVLMLCDGHAESAKRALLVDPNNDYWVRRWNNDNNNHTSQYPYPGSTPAQRAATDPF
jgi:prepilin-type processing-associated H-X9-DG protein